MSHGNFQMSDEVKTSKKAAPVAGPPFRMWPSYFSAAVLVDQMITMSFVIRASVMLSTRMELPAN